MSEDTPSSSAQPPHQTPEQIFDREAHDPARWKIHARELIAAARRLYAEIERLPKLWPENSPGPTCDPNEIFRIVALINPAYLLLGFGAEVYLKTIYIVRRRGVVAQNGTLVFEGFEGAMKHQLHVMAGWLVPDLITPEIVQALERLSVMTTVFGRYPLPKRGATLPYRENSAGVMQRFTIEQRDWDQANAFIDALERLLQLEDPDSSWVEQLPSQR